LLLIGYGASAINPYLAFETLDDMIRQGLLTGIDHRKASITTPRLSKRAS
jgi:glutamate synthase (ferredoxin)